MKNYWQQILGITQTMLEYALSNNWTGFNSLNQQRQELIKSVEGKNTDICDETLGYIKEINAINRQLLSLATTVHDKSSQQLVALRKNQKNSSGYDVS